MKTTNKTMKDVITVISGKTLGIFNII